MVLGQLIEEWLGEDQASRDARERQKRQKEQQLQTAVDKWLGEYDLPPLEQLSAAAPQYLSADQLQAIAHVVDVLKHRQCTDSTCRYRNEPIPDFLK